MKTTIKSRFYLRRGIKQMQNEEYIDSINSFNKAIRLKPDARAYYFRGLVKCQCSVFGDGIKDLDEAIRLKPDFTAAYEVGDIAI